MNVQPLEPDDQVELRRRLDAIPSAAYRPSPWYAPASEKQLDRALWVLEMQSRAGRARSYLWHGSRLRAIWAGVRAGWKEMRSALDRAKLTRENWGKWR